MAWLWGTAGSCDSPGSSDRALLLCKILGMCIPSPLTKWSRRDSKYKVPWPIWSLCGWFSSIPSIYRMAESEPSYLNILVQKRKGVWDVWMKPKLARSTLCSVTPLLLVQADINNWVPVIISNSTSHPTHSNSDKGLDPSPLSLTQKNTLSELPGCISAYIFLHFKCSLL